MKRHLKIIGPFKCIISKIKLFILSGIIAFNYNCEDASTADNNNPQYAMSNKNRLIY